MCIRDRHGSPHGSEHPAEALADRAAPATNRDGSRPCCKRHALARGRNARADQSTDPCALKGKSLEQGLTRPPARQRQAEGGQPKARRIGRRSSLRLRAAPPSDFQQLQGCRAIQTASERIGMAVWPHVICGEVALFWLLELAFCEWAPERQICHLVEKGFCPA